jgi:ferritin-like metal-binding protein YciE
MREHVSRLKDIFEEIGEKSSGKTCEAMKGLIKEGEVLVKAEGDPDVRDAGP